MNDRVPIKGESYVKDLTTGVLINTDNDHYDRILEKRKKSKQEKQELSELRNEIKLMKSMMAQLSKKVNNG